MSAIVSLTKQTVEMDVTIDVRDMLVKVIDWMRLEKSEDGFSAFSSDDFKAMEDMIRRIKRVTGNKDVTGTGQKVIAHNEFLPSLTGFAG